MSDIRSHTVSTRAFDEAARRYDADAASNLMMRWLRRESLRQLLRAFSPGDSVLEIGCGTGEEAIALARRDVRVLATDASPEMVEVVREKASAYGTTLSGLSIAVLPVERLDRLVEERGASSFDGTYSSLGALNCTPDLAPVARHLATLVKPGGTVVISLLNKYCLWEVL